MSLHYNDLPPAVNAWQQLILRWRKGAEVRLSASVCGIALGGLLLCPSPQNGIVLYAWTKYGIFESNKRQFR